MPLGRRQDPERFPCRRKQSLARGQEGHESVLRRHCGEGRRDCSPLRGCRGRKSPCRSPRQSRVGLSKKVRSHAVIFKQLPSVSSPVAKPVPMSVWDGLPVPDERVSIRLKRSAERPLRKGHPWIFDQGIEHQNREGAPGDLASCLAKKRKLLGG